MAITIEEFNRRVAMRREINYQPISRYIQSNEKSDVFYKVCFFVNKVLETKEVTQSRRGRETTEVYNDEAMASLAKAIKDLRNKVYQFDFDEFFMMTLYYVPLLKTRNQRVTKFESPGYFKTALLQKLNGHDVMVGEARVTTKHYPVSNLRRRLYGSLCGLKDNFLFQLRDQRYVCVGWCDSNRYQKFARYCDDDAVISSFENILELINKPNNRFDDDDFINFRLAYQNFLDYSYDYMNEENTCIDLAQFMTEIDDNDGENLIQELETYKAIHDFYLQ